MNDLLVLLGKKRGTHVQAIGEDDVKRSVKKLALLGDGFNLIDIGGQAMIVTVPVELSFDHATILNVAQDTNGVVSNAILINKLGWTDARCDTALKMMLREGLVWIDQPTKSSRPIYVFPSIALP